MHIHGKMTTLLFFCKICRKCIFLTVIFQFYEYEVFVFIFLGNICYKNRFCYFWNFHFPNVGITYAKKLSVTETFRLSFILG